MTETVEQPQPSEPEVVTIPSSPRRDRSWVALGAAIAFVVAVTFGFSYLMRASYDPTPPKAYTTAFADGFDRRNNESGLGTAPGGQQWTSVKGLWAVDAGKAVVSYPDKDTSIATVGSVKYASVQAKVSGKADCGVLARYVDASNYVALVRAFKFGVWNLVSMVQGKQTVLAKLPDVRTSLVDVKLETGQRVLTAMVAGQSASVVLPTKVTTAPVGFIGHNAGATACVWDDLWVYTGG